MDFGGLTYEGQIGTTGFGCPQSTYSTTDPNLTAAYSSDGDLTWGAFNGGLTDLAKDQPPNRANTLTYKLNLSKCLGAKGLSFNSGEQRVFDFVALACGENRCTRPGPGTDTASQVQISFKRT